MPLLLSMLRRLVAFLRPHAGVDGRVETGRDAGYRAEGRQPVNLTVNIRSQFTSGRTAPNLVSSSIGARGKVRFVACFSLACDLPLLGGGHSFGTSAFSRCFIRVLA
jgi:hypothetical protein